MADIKIHRVTTNFTTTSDTQTVTLEGLNTDTERYFVRLCMPMGRGVIRDWDQSVDTATRDRVGYQTGWVTYAAKSGTTDQIELTFNVMPGYAGGPDGRALMEAVVWEYTGAAGGPNEFKKIQSNVFQFAPADTQVQATATIPGGSIDDVVAFHRGVECVGVNDGENKQLGSLQYRIDYFWFFINFYSAQRGQTTARTDHVHAEAVLFSGSNWKVWRAAGNVPSAGGTASLAFYPAWTTNPADSPTDLWDHSWIVSQRMGQTNNTVANRSMLVTPDTTTLGQVTVRAAQAATVSTGGNYAWSRIIYNADVFTAWHRDSWANPAERIPAVAPDAKQSVKIPVLNTPNTAVADTAGRVELDTTLLVEGAHGYGGAAEFFQQVQLETSATDFGNGTNGVYLYLQRPSSYREFAPGDILGDSFWAVSAVQLTGEVPPPVSGRKVTILLKDGTLHKSDFSVVNSGSSERVIELATPAPTTTAPGAPWLITDSESTYWRAVSVAQDDAGFEVEAVRHDPTKESRVEDFADIGETISVVAPPSVTGTAVLSSPTFVHESGNWYAQGSVLMMGGTSTVAEMKIVAASLSVTRTQRQGVSAFVAETFRILLGPHATWASVSVDFSAQGFASDGVRSTAASAAQTVTVPATVP